MSSLIVELPQGKLKGKENRSALNGKPYCSFVGIPYAKSPVGDLRFQAPQPSEKWRGIYDATLERDICMQKFLFTLMKLDGSENCLFLNVDTPKPPSEIHVPKPVMVYIHEGAFIGGHIKTGSHSSDYLIDHDVIVVYIQYRLHVLGFLDLGLPECPGNVGLKDQTLALKWVKENISYFGGDPNNITIFGISSGGSAVHFHTLSPLSEGLFNKAIIQCGTVYSPWSLTFDNKRMARKLGEKCGFAGGSDSELLQHLKKQSAEDLTIYVMEMRKDIKKRNPGRLTLTNPFAPSVEEIKENAFLPDLPHKLQKTAAPLPLIYGVNQKEGAHFCMEKPSRTWDLLNKDFSALLNHNFEIDFSVLPEVSAKVKQHYFDDKEIGPDTVDQIVDFHSDMYFYHLYEPIEFAINSKIPPFVYKFTYDGGLNISRKLVPNAVRVAKGGASHADEFGYLIYSPFFHPHPATDDDLIVIRNMTKLWTNFAKTGAPADESIWAPSTLNQPRYLEIGRTLRLVDGKVYGDRPQFLRATLDPVIKPNVDGTSDDRFPYFSSPQC